MKHSSDGPIFVGGSGRCGTTVLVNTLGLHPRIFTFPDELRLLTAGHENLIDWMHSPESAHLDQVMRQALRGGFVSRAALRELVRSPRGASPGSVFRQLHKGSFYTRPVARNDRDVGLCRAVSYEDYRRAVDQLLATFPEDKLDERRARIGAFMETIAEKPLRAHGASRWCDGTPDNVLHMLDLAAIFPNARFVHIMRDGRFVARSFYRLGWSPSTTAALRQWHQAVTTGRSLGEDLGPTRYFEVTFERLLDDPETHLREILEFLGEDWSAELERHEISKAAVSPPGSETDPALDRLFSTLARDLAAELGWTAA